MRTKFSFYMDNGKGRALERCERKKAVTCRAVCVDTEPGNTASQAVDASLHR